MRCQVLIPGFTSIYEAIPYELTIDWKTFVNLLVRLYVGGVSEVSRRFKMAADRPHPLLSFGIDGSRKQEQTWYAIDYCKYIISAIVVTVIVAPAAVIVVMIVFDNFLERLNCLPILSEEPSLLCHVENLEPSIRQSGIYQLRRCWACWAHDTQPSISSLLSSMGVYCQRRWLSSLSCDLPFDAKPKHRHRDNIKIITLKVRRLISSSANIVVGDFLSFGSVI